MLPFSAVMPMDVENQLYVAARAEERLRSGTDIKSAEEEVDPSLRAPKNKTGEPKVKTIVKETPGLKGTTVRFYFSPGEGIAVGDRLDITTRARSAISRGWISGEHGATYKKVNKGPK